MRLVFICPRYLKNHAGGAEVHCLSLAKKMALAGHEVTLLATTAEDHRTWENTREETSFEEDNVKIRLFKVNEERSHKKYQQMDVLISSKTILTDEEEEIWLNNSVHSDNLYKWLKENKNEFDYAVFIPYLFGLTIKGSSVVPEKSLLIPCLHDEPYARLKVIKKMFETVKALLMNAPEEIRLAEKLYDFKNKDNRFLVSLGFDEPPSPSFTNEYKKLKINKPYITYAGRRENGKNFFLLLEMIKLFNEIYPEKIQLVTMGTPALSLTNDEKKFIIDAGFVSEETKSLIFTNALINCQPSVNESLSITVMESWLAKVPVLVHEYCDVTRDWVNRSKGGLYFSNYQEFEQALIYALDHPVDMKEMGENGYFFVKKNFCWEAVTERFNQAIKKISATL